jgi:hypothetical protein
MPTDFLFIQPSLLRGIGRVADLWGQLDDYNFSVTSSEADLIALRADWETVRQHFEAGLREYRKNPSQAVLFPAR